MNAPATPVLIGVGVGVVALIAVALVGKNAMAVGRGLVGAADGAAAGTVEGIGAIFGVPQTEVNACDRALAEGRTWDASFACPAGRWLKSLF